MYKRNFIKRRLMLLLHPITLVKKIKRRMFRMYEARLKFKLDKKLYTRLNKRKEFNIEARHMYPILYDYCGEAGGMDSYFYQDLWAARKVFKANPDVHYDIGSSVSGFIHSLLSFRGNIVLLDVRPLSKQVDGLSFKQADATHLEGIPDSSITSLSALCSLEHFGLGRYGDPIDPEACFKAFDSIQRVCATGGRVYISVPVGPKDRVEFNAHRIFAPGTIIKAFSKMKLKEFATYNGNSQGKLEIHPEDAVLSSGAMGFFEFEKL